MASTSKRSHTKSRLGCKQCKSRRIKCDERPPCCGNCSQKGLECEFQAYAAVFTSAQLLTPASFNQVSTARSSSLSSSSSSQLPSSPTFSLKDLGLLHHFTLHTCETLPVNDSELYCQIWRQEVPRLAQSYAFLMHAVIAFAAAHQAAFEIDPALRDVDTVRLHFGKALISFREAVDVISAERADAFLTFTILTCFTTLWLETGGSSLENCPVNGFISLLQVVHRSVGVLRQLREPLSKSTVGVLLSHTWNKEQMAHAIEPEVSLSLDRLLFLSSKYTGSTIQLDGSMDETLTDSINKLRKLFTLTEARPTGWEYILSWPMSLTPEFSLLVQQSNPIALCALAHWCVPVRNAPPKWFTGDWPGEMLVMISSQLHGTEWFEGIEWPLWACGMV